MASLANQTISSTYDGLIKTSSDNAVGVSGVQLLQDGSGNDLALSVGRSGNGVTITGSLNATLATAAQPNITSVGTLSSLDVSGNIIAEDAGNVIVRIISTDNSNTSVQFGDPEDNNVGRFIYDHSDNSMQFYTNASERMRIDSSGNVGINCTPSHTLDVNRGSSGVVANFNGVNAYGAETGITLSQGRAKISGFLNTGGGTPGSNLRFYTMPNSGSITEAMRIDSSGSVRLSGTAPSAEDTISKIDFYNNSSSINLAGIEGKRTAGGTNYGSLIFNTTNSGTSSEKMRIDSLGRVGIGQTPDRELNLTLTSDNCVMAIKSGTSRVAGVVLGDSDDDDKGGILYNNASDYLYLSSNGAERMRITSGGDVLVGTTDTNGSASNGHDIVAGRHATVRGSVSSAATGTAYTMFDVPNYSVWLVTAFVPAASNSYNETALVHSNVGAVSVSVLVNGGNIQISNSGASIQVTQTSGATQNIAYSAIRIA